MNPAELYTQLATQAPKRETPVVEPEDNFVLPELTEAEEKELGDYIQQAYSMYEGLPPAQQFIADVAPGTGEAISAYEAKKFGEETKEAFQEGKYGEAALKAGLTGLSALGAIPIIGAAARVPKAAAKTVAKKILKEKVETPKDTDKLNIRRDKTAIVTTKSTYEKINKLFDKLNVKNVHDFGSGLGIGTKQFKNKKVTGHEPFVDIDRIKKLKGREPDYRTADEVLKNEGVKSKDGVVNLSVLNVIENPAERRKVISDIGSLIKDNGYGLITARPFSTVAGEAKKANAKKFGDGFLFGKGDEKTFQTGFNQKQLENLVQETLGKDFNVAKAPKVDGKDISGVSVLITKGTPDLKTKGGSTVKRGGVVKNVEYPVGKNIGGAIYFHKDYISRQPKELQDIYNKAINKLPKDFNFKTIKYDYSNKNIRFEEAPDFDTAREPKVGKNITITPEGDVGKIKDSDLIYHHKWTWVDNDYPGFDVKKEYNWSREWLDKGVDPGAGRKNKWEENLKKAKLPMERN